jgi:hypothetical protein
MVIRASSHACGVLNFYLNIRKWFLLRLVYVMLLIARERDQLCRLGSSD